MDNSAKMNNKELEKSTGNNNKEKPAKEEIEAPLSPVLSNNKLSKKYIARRKSQIRLSNKYSQNSCSSQNKEESSKVVEETDSENVELELRMKRCLEMQRNKKFCYNIAASSSKLTPDDDTKVSSTNNTENCDSVFKIPESPISKVKSVRKNTSNELNLSNSAVFKSDGEKNSDFGFKNANGKILTLSKKSLETVKHLFDDIFDLTAESELQAVTSNNLSPENKIVPFTQISDSQICLAAENAESMVEFLNTQWSPKNESEENVEKKISTPEEVIRISTITDDYFGGFSWDDCLKSLKIKELYKSSLKFMEKDVKNGKLYPFAFTVDDILNSKQYKNKNYKYSLRSKRKSVIMNTNKRKSSRIKQNQTHNKQMNNNDNNVLTCTERNNLLEVFSEENNFGNTLETVNIPEKKFGFTTALGKRIEISEENIEKSKKLFDNCSFSDNILPETSDNMFINGLKNVNNENGNFYLHSGFSTASGTKIKITDELLQKTKHIFQNIDEEQPEKPEKLTTSNETVGFKTASGGNINLSADSLLKAKQIFQYFDSNQIISETTENSQFVGGFATAGGKKLCISEESLTKAKNIFQDCEKLPELSDNLENKDIFGFSTVSGKKITVSKESLKKVKNIFEDCDLTDEYCPKKSETPKNLGFSSASGKNFQISKDSLKKAQNLFDDIKDIAHMVPESPKLPKMIQTSYLAPQTSSVSSPNINLKNSSSKNSKKRSLGLNSCRQIDVSDTNIKRAKLLFEDIEPPKKNIVQNNIPQYVPVKTPQISKSASSTLEMKQHIQILAPKLSPIQNISQMTEIVERISRFSIRERVECDLEKQKNAFEKELEFLKQKMSVIETRLHFWQKQNEVIESGTAEHRRQRPGYLFLQKINSNNRISLQKAVNNRRPGKNTIEKCLNIGLDPNILEINANNAVNLNFYVPWFSNNEKLHPAVIPTDDGGIVIPNQHDYVGITEIERAFLALPGVDPSLVPDKWVSNHFRWIVWKLASLERSFVDLFPNCLTVECVMGQLKYRYDREIDRAERPAIRKITECDDSATKRMVLCVANIIKTGENQNELELTDGWYSLKTILDTALNGLIERKLIKIGQKLIIQGAELLNCEGCSPLELPNNVRLQIHLNSTRRAPWFTKLGYQTTNPGAITIPLRTIHAAGGPIGSVLCYIARCYPVTFMERCDDTITWRNQKAELKRVNQFEAVYINTMEKMQQQIEEELEKKWREIQKANNKSHQIKTKDLCKIQCGETLFHYLEASNDPESVKELLTSDQCAALQEYQTKFNSERQMELNDTLREKLLKEKLEPRNVTSVLKVLLVDVGCVFHHRVLNIWRPNESLVQILKEGTAFHIHNIVPKNNNNLSSTPRTQFEITLNCNTLHKLEELHRTVTPISKTLNCDVKPPFGEFDTVGLVVSVAMQPTHQTIWLTDDNYRFLLVKIREGNDTCCLFDGINAGKIIAMTNLVFQKPLRNYGEAIGNCYTTVSCYPQQIYLQEAMKEFIESLIEDIDEYLKECQQKVEALTRQNVQHSFVLNPIYPHSSKTDVEMLEKKLCGLENSQKNVSESPTLSDEEMAQINSQLF